MTVRHVIVACLCAGVAGFIGVNVYQNNFDPVRIAERERSAAIVQARKALSGRVERLASDPNAVRILAEIAQDCERERKANGWFSAAADCTSIRPALQEFESVAARQERATKFAEIAGGEIVAPLVTGGTGQ